MPADAPGTSNIVDDAGCESGVLPRVSVPPEIMETSLGPNLTAASLLSVSESSKNSVDAESDPEVGIPRVASCPALLQLCNQQIDQPSMPSAGCNSAGIKSHAPPAESLSHLSPSSPDDQACLDGSSQVSVDVQTSVVSGAEGDFEFLSRFLPGVEGAVLWSCWSFPGVTSVIPGSVLMQLIAVYVAFVPLLSGPKCDLLLLLIGSYQRNANQMRFLLLGYWPVAILSWAAYAVVLLPFWFAEAGVLWCEVVGAVLLINSWVHAMSGGGPVSWASSTGAVRMTANGLS
ncbi:hypothetical protein Nepgr_023951 [Nepenthes gracilis]|uniref:Transmembrane protein n=1 Tax=Nepenthes gracilis TaxID=150966 RepID=A0AAD3XYB4_NEPGR|nr:hypothetical protein Nepgr_023951 [Nepenthes gracilis]